MAIAVLRFPGTNNEDDILNALSRIKGADPYLVPSYSGVEKLQRADGVVIPGGFSYGDYIRAGAVASVGSIMDGVKEIVDSDKPVLGICNGFQILAEVGLLPGALLHNTSARFICRWLHLKVTENTTLFTEGIEGCVLKIPIAHAEGNYFCNGGDLTSLKNRSGAVFRYSDRWGNVTQDVNPNGSLENIAGVVNERGNVLGMMPHPERASRDVLGSVDGRTILENFVRASRAK